MTSATRTLSRPARIYIGAVVASGTIAIVHSATTLLGQPARSDWLVLAGLTLLTGSFSIKVPAVSARISVSEAFVFAALVLYGPAVATLIVALDTLVVTSWLRGPQRSLLRAWFNMSAGALAIYVAGQVFAATLSIAPVGPTRLLFPVLALALSCFTINSWLVAVALGFERTLSPFGIWRRNLLWLSLNYFGGASVALLLVTYTSNLDLTALGVVIPLLVIIYLTFRTSLGRLDDANKHVSQLNELYLSTVETLAMAVDAKDQITHGHIRRVQVYATELAKRLGVSDDRQLKAVAAAALLHDMGKLAIPERILNKPGRLTPAEFNRMKQHSDLGADLLSSIRFPYPVVPIVRHHHENFDGSGYPSGVAGTDIPLGARILSVVDCFDALTSDRPYRPRMSTEEAFQILHERRGSMYDPLVVDTFTRAFAEIAPAAIRAGLDARSMFSTDTVDHAANISVSKPLKQIRANASEAALLIDCRQQIGNASSTKQAIEIAARCLRELTPATVYALYRYDPRTDTLTCDFAVGDTHKLLNGFAIKNGERVTGWSGANRNTCVNSDAILDMGGIAEQFEPPLRSTMSTPITDKDVLVGVLSAYSARDNGFLEAHRYVFEQVASVLLDALKREAGANNVISFHGHGTS